MKTFFKITCVFAILNFGTIFSQEKNIETHSIDVENFISYIVENYERDGDNVYNLHFLIQTTVNGFSVENKVVLQQGFGLLSKRLSEDNSISILGYSGLNGVALEKNSVKNIKKIMNAIDSFKSSIKAFYEDGISFTYEYVNENFDKTSINRVIMIRIPNSESTTSEVNSTQKARKNKNNAILVTAIALLPEIISVLKD